MRRLETRLAQVEARLAVMEAARPPAPAKPPPFTEREVSAFARIASSIALDDEFEAGDLSGDPAGARQDGMLLSKVERTPGGLLGLRAVSRLVHGRKRWMLRLPAEVDWGGPSSAPHDAGPGA